MVLYRSLLTLAALPFLVGLLVSVLRGRSPWTDLTARLGAGQGLGLGRSQGPARTGGIWLHAASVGELTAARPLIDALRAASADVPFLITSNSATGRALVRGWDLPATTAELAPLDLRWAVRAVLRRHRPKLLISLENELWPNRFALAGTLARAPVALVSARVSARAAARWAKLPGLARQVLGQVALVAPQDPQSQARLLDLGLAPHTLAPQILLKAAVSLPTVQAPELRAVFQRSATVLAASTHAPEEEQVLQAFSQVLALRPEMKLILAPRHPKRGAELAQRVAASGLRMARRSLGETPDAATQVYLADTLGEMPLWYGLAGVCFVGGSWARKGGHTPFEPAAAGCAIFHGPDVSNFAEPYAALDRAGAAQMVDGPDALAQAILTADPKTLAQRAGQTLAALAPKEALDDLARRLLDLKGDSHVHPT